MSKKIIYSLLGVLILGLTTLALVKPAMAQDPSLPNFPLVEKIASKFGLNQDEVSATFKELHQERLQERQAERESQLDKAVADGVITKEQKQLLIQKHQENQQQRQAQRQAHQQEMMTWMEQNGIDHNTLKEYLGGFGQKRRMVRRMAE